MDRSEMDNRRCFEGSVIPAEEEEDRYMSVGMKGPSKVKASEIKRRKFYGQ